MKIRRAAPRDAPLLLAWRNDPVTRAMSLDPREVNPEAHAMWLAGRLADPKCELWIGEAEDVPVAQVRFDLVETGVAIVSVSVAPAARGRGHATAVLRAAMASQALGASKFRATVRSENEASLRLFERAGFTAVRREQAVVLFERAAPSNR